MKEPKRPVERGIERLRLHAPVSIKLYGSTRSSPAQMFDLSMSGCCVVSEAPLRTGSQILVRIPGLKFRSATVAWRRGEVAGVEFHKPLHPTVVEEYARYYPTPPDHADAGKPDR